MSLTLDSPSSAQFAIDYSGRYVAIYSIQSNIKVWKSSKGTKSIEISVKSNVGPYSVVSWSRQELYVHFSKKIIWTSVSTDNDEELSHPILAYGTTGGCVGIMCGLIDQEIASNCSTHSACVRDVIWSSDCCKLYSSSDDKTIVEWTLAKYGLTPGRVLKAGKKSVCKLASSCNAKFLIAASTHIRVWDIENEVVVQKMTSHTSEVTSLVILESFPDGNVSQIVSIGQDEQMVSVSKLNLECESEYIHMLRCPYHPISIQKSQTKNELFILASNGIIYMYIPPFENEFSKPIAPASSLQIISDDNVESKETISIPILSVYCLKEQDCLLVVYGNISKPVFEKIKIDYSQKRMTVKRSFQRMSSLKEKQNKDVISTSNSTVPIQMVPTHQSKKVKRKRQTDSQNSDDNETTLGELISQRDEAENSSQTNDKPDECSAPIVSVSHVQMLCQSLQSDDSSLFNQAISSTSSKIIHKTIRSLPINYVLPLIEKLMSIMHTTPFRAPILLCWIQPCLSLHTSYLLTVPDIIDRLGLLYQILETRAACYEDLCKLEGKLELLLASNTKNTPLKVESSIKPRFVFVDNDDSSTEANFTEFHELEIPSSNESVTEESADELMT